MFILKYRISSVVFYNTHNQKLNVWALFRVSSFFTCVIFASFRQKRAPLLTEIKLTNFAYI